MKFVFFLIISIICCIVLAQEPSPLSFESYVKEIDQWHQGRIKGLTKEHGWLSLIALDWFQEGNNTVRTVGTITLKKGSVVLALENGLKGMLNGKEFTAGPIVPDKDKVLIGTKALSVIKRGEKYAVRLWDSDYSARKNFTAIERYPVSPHWKIEARWEKYKEPKKVVIPTVIPGLLQEGIAPGVAVFTLNGKTFKLEPTIEEGETDYFFVFGDKTNGKETYGAGRFLYSNPPKNGKIILDFNRSYNPPCAFTDYATCPVPVPSNKLSIRIEAGEKKFKLH